MKSTYEVRRDKVRRLIATRFNNRKVDFADAIGLNQPSLVSRYVSDKPGTAKNIGDELARKIEKAFDKPEFWMDNPDQEDLVGFYMLEDGQRTYVVEPKTSSPNSETAEAIAGYVRLSLLNVTASAGKFALPVDHVEVLRYLDVLEQWVRLELRANPAHIQIITARGDSMSPTIRNGDVVFVDTSVKAMDANGLYAMLWGDHVVLKRLQRLRDGRLAIKSDNPAYETEFAGGADPLEICGRAVGRWGLERF